MKSIETLLSGELGKRGFQSKGRQYLFRTENDVIVTLAIEKVSLTYIWFALIPLFLPSPGFVYLTYGNRVNALYKDVKALKKDAEQAAVVEMCSALMQHLDNELLPWAKKLSTANNLCAYIPADLNTPPKRRESFLSCTPDKKMRLLIYGLLFLKRYDEALNIAERYDKQLKANTVYTKELTGKLVGECEQIVALISAGKVLEIEQLIERNISDNLSLFSK